MKNKDEKECVCKKNVEELLERGKKALKADEPEKCIGILDRILSMDPENIKAISLKGTAYRRLGMYGSAADCFQKVLELDPGSRQALRELVVIYTSLRDHDRVIGYNDALIELDGENSGAWASKGRAHIHKGETDRAMECYRRVLDREPHRVDLWEALGKMHQHRGELSSAAECFRRALSISPNSESAWRGKGDLYMLEGDGEKAVRCYERVEVGLCGEGVEIKLAAALILAREPEAALSVLDGIESTEAYLYRYAAYREKGELEKAGDCMNRALGERPELAVLFSREH